MAQTLAWIEEAITDGKPHQISVVNANKYYLMSRDKVLRDIITNSDLVIPEWAVVWGAKKLRLPRLNHSGGILLAREFIPYAAKKGFRVYFLGARPEVVRMLVDNMKTCYPKLNVSGFHDGFLSNPEIEEKVISEIQKSRTDVLFVALGSPKQEYWIFNNIQRINVPVSIGVGGSFDVLSGQKKDTPAWARGKGLEWLYRIIQNPRAYTKRYLITNTWFVWQIIKQMMKRS